MLDGLVIIMFCVVAACSYGILHDQITARICIEYFTVRHPQILPFLTESSTILGFAWGIIATWWVGLGLGIALAIAARVGNRRKKSVRDLIKPVLILFGMTGILALIAGAVGYSLASSGLVKLVDPLASLIPPTRHTYFLTDVFAHSMSYAAGTVGGLAVIVKTWRSRSLQ